MKLVKGLFLFSTLIFLASCGSSTDSERSFKSDDKEHISYLLKLLERRQIPFEYKDGVIRYKNIVQEEFENANKALTSVTPTQFIDSDVRSYFHSILDTEYVEYIELDRDAGTWTAWWPQSEERKTKILDQVEEFRITLNFEKDTDCEDEPSMSPAENSGLEAFGHKKTDLSNLE